MRITRKEFDNIYADCPQTINKDIFFGKGHKDDQDFIDNYLSSKMWRMNNLYTIKDKRSNLIKFEMNKGQHQVFAASLIYFRILILKTRQIGISTFWLVSFFDDCLFNPGFESGLMAQGDAESKQLLKKIKLLWQHLNPEIKRLLNIKLTANSRTEIMFSNGSTIYIQRSFRSGTLQRLHISEFSKIANRDPSAAEETMTGSLQTLTEGMVVVIEGTGEGENLFKDLVYAANDLDPTQRTAFDFFPIFLGWTSDENCVLAKLQKPTDIDTKYFNEIENELKITLSQEQKNYYISKRRELPETVNQEYPATIAEAFIVNRQGVYFADEYLSQVKGQDRLVKDLYDPTVNVQVAVDIGWDDAFVLIFFQTLNGEYRIINEYVNDTKPISHFTDYMKRMTKKYKYKITNVIIPHDSKQHSVTDGKNPEKRFREEGFKKLTPIKQTRNLPKDIDMIRIALESMWIDPKCKYVIGCLMNYRREFDKKKKVFKNAARHDKWSHGADALRYMCKGKKIYAMDQSPQKRRKRRRSGCRI